MWLWYDLFALLLFCWLIISLIHSVHSTLYAVLLCCLWLASLLVIDSAGILIFYVRLTNKQKNTDSHPDDVLLGADLTGTPNKYSVSPLQHPCLKEPGSFSGTYGWHQSLKYKCGNDRTKRKALGCPELRAGLGQKISPGISSLDRPTRY